MIDPSLAELLSCLADEKTAEIFKKIHDDEPFTVTSMKLTRKQYHSRLSKMIKVNLVYRLAGKYRLTSLGKIVYGCVELVASTLGEDYWRLKAIDSLCTANTLLPLDERTRIISTLIGNENIKQILLSH